MRLDEACRRLLENDPTLTTLSLHHNEIGDAGARALATSLETNTTLEWLNLNSNRIRDDGARALKRTLQKYNRNLTRLDLDSNTGISNILKSEIRTLVERNKNKQVATKRKQELRKQELLKRQEVEAKRKQELLKRQEVEAKRERLKQQRNAGRIYEAKRGRQEVEGKGERLKQQRNTERIFEAKRGRQGSAEKHTLGFLILPPERKIEKSLRHAARNGQWELVRLLDDVTNVDAVDSDGSTALYHASQQGQVEAAKLLVDHGAKINARCKGGKTPLMAASKNGHGEVVQLLLDHGADANLKAGYSHKQSALDMAKQKGHSQVVSILKAQQQGVAGFPIKRSPAPQASPQKTSTSNKAEEEAGKLKERREQEAERLRLEELALERSRQEKELERKRLEQEAMEQRRREEEAARLRLEEQKAEEQRQKEQEVERMRLEREAEERDQVAEEREEQKAEKQRQQEQEAERMRLEREAAERDQVVEELEEQKAEEQRQQEQEAERMRFEREAVEKHRLAEEQRKQEESKQEQFRKDCAEKFQARVALDQEMQRLQDFIEAARGATDPDVTSAAARAKAEYEALVPLQSLPQWASATDLEKQIASLEARLQMLKVGEAGVESANELMELKGRLDVERLTPEQCNALQKLTSKSTSELIELKRRLDVERLTPEQYNALQKLTSNIQDFDRSLESVQGLPEELEAMPKHIQAYFFAFCQSFQRTYLAAEVISSGTVTVALSSKLQGTIAAVLNVVGKGLENFLWIFQDFFNGNSRDGYMLAYRRIAKKICVMDNFSDFEIGVDKDNASIIQKLKASILEPLTKVASCHLRKVHLISLEELDPIGLKVIDDLHTITIGVLQLWEEDRDRYNDLKQADEDEKAAFVLECLGVIAKGSCLEYVGVHLQSSKSSKIQMVTHSDKQACHCKEVASEPPVEQHCSSSEEAAKLSEFEKLRSRVKLLESENKRKTQVIKRLEKLIPDDEVDIGSGGGGLQQTLISKKTSLRSHSLQGSRMDKDEPLRVRLERHVDQVNRQFEEVGYKMFLMERVLSFSEAWQLIENILLRSSDSISGFSSKNKAVRPHEALVPDKKGFFVVGNRILRIGTVPDTKEKIWEKGHDIKIYHNNHKVKSVKHWFEANGLEYRFQLHCKPAVLEMFSDEIAMAYGTFECTFLEPDVQQDGEIEDANRSALFDT